MIIQFHSSARDFLKTENNSLKIEKQKLCLPQFSIISNEIVGTGKFVRAATFVFLKYTIIQFCNFARNVFKTYL